MDLQQALQPAEDADSPMLCTDSRQSQNGVWNEKDILKHRTNGQNDGARLYAFLEQNISLKNSAIYFHLLSYIQLIKSSNQAHVFL